MLRVVLTLVVIALIVYALTDLVSADKEQTGGLPKWAWAAVIVLLPVAGSAAWLLFRRTARTVPGRPASRGPSLGGTPRRGPVAPDDDPEFLWRLEQERRRKQQGDPGQEPPV